MNIETIVSILTSLLAFVSKEAKAANTSIDYNVGPNMRLGVGPKGSAYLNAKVQNGPFVSTINLIGIEAIAKFISDKQIDITALEAVKARYESKLTYKIEPPKAKKSKKMQK